MEIIVFKKGESCIREDVDVTELKELLADPNCITWVDVLLKSEADFKESEEIYANVFKFHHLTIEDCREERNQPKVEEFPKYLFYIVHGVKSDANSTHFVTKELDGYLGANFVVTNRADEFKSIDAIKEQARNNPRLFDKGAAFLLHQILDVLVDNYMPVVDDFDSAISDLENRVYRSVGEGNKILEEIMKTRKSIARLKRISTRQLEVLYKLSHGQFSLIPADILPFYRDVHDHLLRIVDLAENYRDLIGGIFDIHFSVTASKTNVIMKVLALFSAILMPLTLISGIYGMNFENMPELHTRYGYFITLGFMATLAGTLMIYFWRRGWFGD
ncbi:MAG: magnesium/cobalt transporter CorA [Pyrinomonadaceae bacterium]